MFHCFKPCLNVKVDEFTATDTDNASSQPINMTDSSPDNASPSHTPMLPVHMSPTSLHVTSPMTSPMTSKRLDIHIRYSDVNAIDFSHLEQFTSGLKLTSNTYKDKVINCLNDSPNKQHYKLLAFLTMFLKSNSKVTCLYTSLGLDALALSLRPDITVVSYDVVDRIIQIESTPKQKSNICLKIQSYFDDMVDIVESPLIYISDPSEDINEFLMLIQILLSSKYNGLLMFNGIYSSVMVHVWKKLVLQKYDVSSVGNSVLGTGIIVFGNFAQITVS